MKYEVEVCLILVNSSAGATGVRVYLFSLVEKLKSCCFFTKEILVLSFGFVLWSLSYSNMFRVHIDVNAHD